MRRLLPRSHSRYAQLRRPQAGRSSLQLRCCRHQQSAGCGASRFHFSTAAASAAQQSVVHGETAVSSSALRTLPSDGLTLADFITSSSSPAHTRPSVLAVAASAQPEPGVGCDSEGGSGVAEPATAAFSSSSASLAGHHYYIETYGCAMNTSDSEIVEAVLTAAGLRRAPQLQDAAVILVNTCAIRENAEAKVWQRLHVFRSLSRSPQHRQRAAAAAAAALDLDAAVSDASSSQPSSAPRRAPPRRPLVAVLGCMAERLKDRLLQHDGLVDVVVGPDAYRDLPRLLSAVWGEEGEGGGSAMNVQLSLEETYADIAPVRPASARSAFVSIMRGCDNLCSYCIVPFTRGRERSRDADSVLDEVRQLSHSGCKEVTLLGQNVNSYNQTTAATRRLSASKQALTAGFLNISRRPLPHYDFTQLLQDVSAVDPEMRIRYTSPHPKDVPTSLLQLIRSRHNICKHIHLPCQSGSSTVLQRMRRGYDRAAYLRLIAEVRELLPSASISTDIIAGFCGETEAEHEETLSLMERVCYDQAFMFAYSQRDKTHAHRTMTDDVPHEVKARRLQQIVDTFHVSLSTALTVSHTASSPSASLTAPASCSLYAQRCIRIKNQQAVGSVQLVLVEGPSRRDPSHLTGRTDGNRHASFPALPLPSYSPLPSHTATEEMRLPAVGDYVAVEVLSASSVSFRCHALGLTSMTDFFRRHPQRDSVSLQLAAVDRTHRGIASIGDESRLPESAAVNAAAAATAMML